MSRDRLPPPQAEACLTTSRASRFQGGTLIAEDVWTLEEHGRRLSSPDGYRPAACPRCGEVRVHLHDHLERKPLGLVAVTVGIVRGALCGGRRRRLQQTLSNEGSVYR